MCESFGARLRQRREQQHIDLTTIADQTKIKLSLLEALERDDVSHWPGGIFRRAFIRTYAHAIGLDPDVIVREFLEQYPDPIEVVATVGLESVVAPGVDGASQGAGPPTRFRYLIGTAIDALTRLAPGIAQTRRANGEDLAGAPAVEPPMAESPVEDPVAADAEPATVRGAAPVKDVDVAAAAQGADVVPVKPAEVVQVKPAEVVAVKPAEVVPVDTPPAFEPDLLAAAQLCTELSRIDEALEAAPLLQEAARIVDAVGLIVWVWDPQTTELTPALAHGYSDRVLAQLPRVRRDANNATAAAFRSAQTCVVNGSDVENGALAVPLLTPVGCGGVLAIELKHSSAQSAAVRALVTIFAAQLARLVGIARPTAADRRLA